MKKTATINKMPPSTVVPTDESMVQSCCLFSPKKSPGFWASSGCRRLFERIFRRKRLAYLDAQNRLLMDMNELLVTGDSVQLTISERRMILDAVEDPHFKDRVELPQTRKHIRVVRNNLREKIKASIKEAREKR